VGEIVCILYSPFYLTHFSRIITQKSNIAKYLKCRISG